MSKARIGRDRERLAAAARNKGALFCHDQIKIKCRLLRLFWWKKSDECVGITGSPCGICEILGDGFEWGSWRGSDEAKFVYGCIPDRLHLVNDQQITRLVWTWKKQNIPMRLIEDGSLRAVERRLAEFRFAKGATKCATPNGERFCGT